MFLLECDFINKQQGLLDQVERTEEKLKNNIIEKEKYYLGVF